MKITTRKFIAGILSAAMLCTAVPAVTAMTTDMSNSYVIGAAETTNIYSTDFEDGSIGSFVPRMNEGDSVVLNPVSDASAAYEGSGYLNCSGRAKSWQGISLPMDNITSAGKEYMVSAYVKSPWYATITLSMQYDDTSGTTKYANITNAVSQGEWVGFTDVKFSFPAGSTNRSIYFECSDANVEINLDDFSLTTAPVYQIEQDIPALKDVYADYFKFGGAVTATELASESAQALILKHYNSLTPGNELKPESLLDQAACQAEGNNVNPIINIASARSILDFARDNNIPVRGHVLVWHSQTPGWFFKENFSDDGDFVSKEIMLQRMENYIKNVMEALAEEYPTVDFYAWDVVNETWLDDGSYRKPGTYDENPNYSGWVQVFGDNSFIDYAFEYARKYAPEGCKLYYNDFNEYMPQKTAAIVEMANRLKEKGIIDGIGMQSHLDVRSGSDAFPSVSVYEKAVKAFAETGLDIQVTELDATVNGNTEELFEAQAQYYSDVMDVCVKYADSISAVVLWGTTDDKSWRASKYPLVFNEDFTAKPSFYSIIDGIEYVEPTTTEPVVTTTAVTTTTEITTSEETTTTTAIFDYRTLLEYDESPIKVGETKAIKYSHPDADVNPGLAKVYEASSNISYEIDEENHIINVTALEAGEAKLYIMAEGCAFGAYAEFTIEEDEPIPDPYTELDYDASPIRVGEVKEIKYSVLGVNPGYAIVSEASSNISYEIDDENHVVYVTALEAGNASLYIRASNAPFGSYAEFTIEEEVTTTTEPVITTTVTTTTEPTTTEDITIDIGTASLLGDVNVDGEVAASDIVVLSKFLINNTIFPLKDSTAAANADVTADKKINAIDIQSLIEYVTGALKDFILE